MEIRIVDRHVVTESQTILWTQGSCTCIWIHNSITSLIRSANLALDGVEWRNPYHQ